MEGFAQNNDIYFIIVTHPNKPTKNGSDKIYDEPDVYSLARVVCGIIKWIIFFVLIDQIFL